MQPNPIAYDPAAVLSLAVAVRDWGLLVGELGIPVQHGEGDSSVEVIHVHTCVDHVLDTIQKKVWQGLGILLWVVPPIGWDTLC